MPKWTVPFVWAMGILVLYGVVPWALSLIGPRYGWAAGAPSPWNMIGLVVVAAALAILLWCISLHFRQYSSQVPMDSRPKFLLLNGPYRISRNPLYISDFCLLLGWALFYGSPWVLLAGLGFGAYLAFVLVPTEERQLLEQFGDEYLTYQRTVPRWLGRPRS